MNLDIFQGKRILITGGSGFIGGCLIRRLINQTKAKIFNLDKLGYASDLLAIKHNKESNQYSLIKCDLSNYDETKVAIKKTNPDLIFHLAAESHVDKSIENPFVFLQSNIIGTFNLLEISRDHYEKLSNERRKDFRFLHISTDEVFGSLGKEGSFSEASQYDPRSPYSATKASSDHLVNAWYHTYGLPVIKTNCSNNYGPWQFPEKLIPLAISKAIKGETIPIYGDGSNIRDWLYVEDHINGLILAIQKGNIGKSYCIGGFGEKSNLEIVENICSVLNEINPKEKKYQDLIKFVKDRPGHDQRYSIDSSFIQNKLGWSPKTNLSDGIRETVIWYVNNQDWCFKDRIS